MKVIPTFEEFLFEGSYNDPVRDMHFETDPKKLEKLKLDYGKRSGGITRREQIENADYALKRFRKEIKYGHPNNISVDVFIPGGYDAIYSNLGDGPHTKKIKSNWNQRSYEKWVKEMSGNGGSENAFDMAQNALHEPGLIAWVKKNYPDNDPMDRIQWDIEAYA